MVDLPLNFHDGSILDEAPVNKFLLKILLEVERGAIFHLIFERLHQLVYQVWSPHHFVLLELLVSLHVLDLLGDFLEMIEPSVCENQKVIKQVNLVTSACKVFLRVFAL